MAEFPTSKFVSYFKAVTFRVKNVSFCAKKLLEFGSKVVTFRVNVTFCVNCYILRHNSVPLSCCQIIFPMNLNLCCSAFFQKSYCRESHDFNFVNFCILSWIFHCLGGRQVSEKTRAKNTLYFITQRGRISLLGIQCWPAEQDVAASFPGPIIRAPHDQ